MPPSTAQFRKHSAGGARHFPPGSPNATVPDSPPDRGQLADAESTRGVVGPWQARPPDLFGPPKRRGEGQPLEQYLVNQQGRSQGPALGPWPKEGTGLPLPAPQGSIRDTTDGGP